VNHILREKDPRKVIASLSCLPNDLTSAYEAIFQRIERHRDRDFVIRTLSWIYHAQRPLLAREIQEALSVQLSDNELFDDDMIRPDDLVKCCESLITWDRLTGVIRFTHYTVHEFLRAHRLNDLLSTVDLAKICLTYLTFNVFRKGPCLDFEQMENRFKQYRFGSYAVDYWPIYTKGSGELDCEIQRLLMLLSSS
jgi:hypothetical protein